MYVLLSMRPEYNTKIKAYAHLAPAAFMEHQKSPFFGISAFFLAIFQVQAIYVIHIFIQDFNFVYNEGKFKQNSLEKLP